MGLSPQPSSIRPLKILYAEDLLQLREFMTIMLGREGHKVETAENGELALSRLQTDLSGFDVLITDHHMPRMNGLELVGEVRKLPFPGKIIVFSSELSDFVHDQYKRLGVDLTLPKPIFPVTFRQMLNQLFEPRNATEEASGLSFQPYQPHGMR